MANVLVEEQYLQNIAGAIRTKGNTQDTYTPAQMASAIINLPSGSSFATPTKINEVLAIPQSLIVATIVQEESVSDSKILTVS